MFLSPFIYLIYLKLGLEFLRWVYKAQQRSLKRTERAKIWKTKRSRNRPPQWESAHIRVGCPSTWTHTGVVALQPHSRLQIWQPQPTSDSNLMWDLGSKLPSQAALELLSLRTCEWKWMLTMFLSESRSAMSDSLQRHGLYSPWNSPDQNTGVGSLSLLQGIFPRQGLNPGLWHCRWILYQLPGKPLMSFQVTASGGDVETEKDPMVLVSHALCIPFVYGGTLTKFNQRSENRQKWRKTGKGDHIKRVWSLNTVKDLSSSRAIDNILSRILWAVL